MKSNKSNKRLIGSSLSVLLLIGVTACCWYINSSVNQYRLEVMQVGDSGYGYRVYQEEQVIILQPFIPVIPGRKAFQTEQDALHLGSIVLERIKAGDDFAVSKADLKELGILN